MYGRLTAVMAALFCLASPWCAADEPLGSGATLSQLQQSKQKIRAKDQHVMSVSAALAPDPVLRYRLAIPQQERVPQPALLRYARALAALLSIPQQQLRIWESAKWQSPEDGESSDDKQVAEALRRLQLVLDEVHGVAVADNTAWGHQLDNLPAPDRYRYPVPAAHNTRPLFQMLNLQIRYQLQQDDVAGAIQSIRDGLGLAHFLGQSEAEIPRHVAAGGIAMMRERLLEVIRHPDGPNLYWALATIPRPVLRVTDLAHEEFSCIAQNWPVLARAETENWPHDQAMQEWTTFLAGLKEAAGDNMPIETFRLLVPEGVAAAREKLLKRGFSAERLNSMPGPQIILAETSLEVARICDDLSALLLLPARQSTRVQNSAGHLDLGWPSFQPDRTNLAGSLVGIFCPAMSQMREVEVRAEMRINQLMTLEAIRMHVATHEGQLPDSLEDLSPVPAMPDPYTGGQFHFEQQQDDQGVFWVLAPHAHYDWPGRTLRFRFRNPHHE